jgi:hypothetical protein
MNEARIPRTLIRFGFAAVLLMCLAIICWQALFHGPVDRKDLRYQAWKHGLYPFRIESALETMVADPDRNSVVVGRTASQLASRFGYVLPINQAPQYDQFCYENSPYRGQSVLILRSSNWMVLMENGRAKDLILIKGC